MKSFERAIIVGASSGIGESLARQLAQGGCRVALVARRADTLQRVAATLPPDTALVYPHDVTDYDAVPELFQRICRDLNGLDLIVYAAGVLPHLLDEQYDFAQDKQCVEVNLLGGIAWLNEAAHRFQVAQGGTIVGISSVAGDRGRRGQPVYGASKAALNTYLEALRNRVARYQVRVVTVKPGPVDTPMIAGRGKQPLTISVDAAAAQILSAARRGARTAYIPRKWRPIMAVIRAIPSPIFQRLNI